MIWGNPIFRDHHMNEVAMFSGYGMVYNDVPQMLYSCCYVDPIALTWQLLKNAMGFA